MKALNQFLIFIFAFIIFSCERNTLQEYIEYRTEYSYDGQQIDSSMQLAEHSWFNNDSIKIKSITKNAENFFISEMDENDMLKREYFSSDSVLDYSTISRFDDCKREVLTIFQDNQGQAYYEIRYIYLGNTDLLLKQIDTSSDSSQTEYYWTYDEYSNLTAHYRVIGKDTVELEKHILDYNEIGEIVTDTAIYPSGRKIINNAYRDGLLTMSKEEFEVMDEQTGVYQRLGKSYWKNYFFYDNNRNLVEKRIIRMYYSGAFRLNSRLVWKYDLGLPIEEILYNAEGQKVNSITKKFIFV